MMKIKQIIPLFLLITVTSLFSTASFAECGGATQCIGIGETSTAALAAHHGGTASAPVTPTVAFGSADISVGASSFHNYDYIIVEAVTGPVGTQATLGTIYIDGADAADFTITDNNCATDGPIHGGSGCYIEMAFAPSSLGNKTATLHVPLNPACPTCITERTAILTGSGGQDNPRFNTEVTRLIEAQASAAERFAQTQISNVNDRLHSLHNKLAYKQPQKEKKKIKKELTEEEKVREYIDAADKPEERESQTLDLSLLPQFESNNISYWVDGHVHFGVAGIGDFVSTSEIRSRTDGISTGVDGLFTPSLAFGVGIGYANDLSHVGIGGSVAKSEATSIFGYGSYLVGHNFFIDALIGYSELDFDLARYVLSLDMLSDDSRSGDQLFASLGLSYFYMKDVFSLAPYLRFDVSSSTLDAYTETGLGQSALTYSALDVDSSEVSLGLVYQSTHTMRYGWVKPKISAEYTGRDSERSSVTTTYVSTGTQYAFDLDPVDRGRGDFSLGLGADFIFEASDLTLGVDYRHTENSVSRDEFLWFSLTKALDGRIVLPVVKPRETFKRPIYVEFSALHSNNINNAPDALGEALSEQIHTMKVSTAQNFPVGRWSRINLTGFLSMDTAAKYSRLDKFSLGVKAEYQTKTSREYDAYTIGVLTKLIVDESKKDEFLADIRSGSRYSLGLTLRQNLTDTLRYYLEAQKVFANGYDFFGVEGFAPEGDSIRAVVDLSLNDAGSVYLGLQYKKSRLVSYSAQSSYFSSSYVTPALSSDFVFRVGNNFLTPFGYNATTNILTAGYNYPLGHRDSVDFSWDMIHSKPDFADLSYTTNQLSAAYITRF